jgi:hypothetical protein
MSAALAAPEDTDEGRAARPRTRPPVRGPRPAAPTGAVHPRLLLPPVAEPPRTTVPGNLAQGAAVRSVLSPLTSAAWPLAGPVVPDPVEDAPLDDPTRLCGAVVMAAIEALTSARPLVQLARWVSPGVYEALARAARPGPAAGRRGVVLRGVRVCRIGPTVAEGSAVVHDGTRVRAAAVRFEVHRGSWRATVLQIG